MVDGDGVGAVEMIAPSGVDTPNAKAPLVHRLLWSIVHLGLDFRASTIYNLALMQSSDPLRCDPILLR
jgi:hypothetical protein